MSEREDNRPANGVFGSLPHRRPGSASDQRQRQAAAARSPRRRANSRPKQATKARPARKQREPQPSRVPRQGYEAPDADELVAPRGTELFARLLEEAAAGGEGALKAIGEGGGQLIRRAASWLGLR